MDYVKSEIGGEEYRIGIGEWQNNIVYRSTFFMWGYNNEYTQTFFDGENIILAEDFYGFLIRTDIKFFFWEIGLLNKQDDYELYLNLGCMLNIEF